MKPEKMSLTEWLKFCEHIRKRRRKSQIRIIDKINAARVSLWKIL